MTWSTSKQSATRVGSRWRRVVAGGVAGVGLALSVSLGMGAGIAQADVLDQLEQEFSTGAGAGQVANLLNQSLKLRSQGYKPTQANLNAVQAALDKRPNQKPLIDALQATVAGQLKLQSQMGSQSGSSSQGPIGFSWNAGPWGPNWNPMAGDGTEIFPMPGR
ncbi:hypothetical protein [Mycolicibacterium palauense]|uniref:hypothetical protein n=1 Tax=Mycolicibacterium palauense TaxID=2034511 RepID=UPI000BFEC1BA|nr:hypothetical protein [Mycolicibacterium palauense]